MVITRKSGRNASQCSRNPKLQSSWPRRNEVEDVNGPAVVFSSPILEYVMQIFLLGTEIKGHA